MTVALDANVLVYAEGVNGPERQEQAIAAIELWSDERYVLPAHAGLELYRVLLRKGRRSAEQARVQVARWIARCEVVPTDASILGSAMELVVAHRIAPLDAVVFASAAKARCAVLLSEDMQHGFTWRGTTIHNPFHD